MNVESVKWELFDKVYRTYQNEVYKTCLFYSRDEHVSKDITQRAFFSFYHHIENVDPEKTKAYLIRTAKNMTMNWLRDFKRLKEGWIEDLNDEDLKVLSVEEIYIREDEERLARTLSHSILEQLYNKNKRWYEVVVLAYYLGIPQEDIAESYDVHIDVVYSRLYRAKQWIRKNYKEQYEEYVRLTQG